MKLHGCPRGIPHFDFQFRHKGRLSVLAVSRGFVFPTIKCHSKFAVNWRNPTIFQTTRRGRLERANQRVGALRMFFKRRLRDERRARRAQMIVFKRAFHFCFTLGLRCGHKRGFPLFLGLSFLFTTVFSDQRFDILALTFWRVLLLCTSRSLFNFGLQISASVSVRGQGI